MLGRSAFINITDVVVAESASGGISVRGFGQRTQSMMNSKLSELKPLDLPFGNNFILSLRDELFDMEAVSRIFEEDIDIVNEVQRHIKNGSDMAQPSTLSKDIAKEMDEAYSVIDEAPQSNIHAEVQSTCYIDDSDSEIFRVKRRSYKATAQKNNQFCPFKTRTS
ncbi:hypothetical protein Tco_1277213, partial [Tanacetum coccineum]